MECIDNVCSFCQYLTSKSLSTGIYYMSRIVDSVVLSKYLLTSSSEAQYDQDLHVESVTIIDPMILSLGVVLNM